MADKEAGSEEVCVMDASRGPLIVRPQKGAPTVRLALRALRSNQLVYVTYDRTDEHDAEGRPIYR